MISATSGSSIRRASPDTCRRIFDSRQRRIRFPIVAARHVPAPISPSRYSLLSLAHPICSKKKTVEVFANSLLDRSPAGCYKRTASATRIIASTTKWAVHQTRPPSPSAAKRRARPTHPPKPRVDETLRFSPEIAIDRRCREIRREITNPFRSKAFVVASR